MIILIFHHVKSFYSHADFIAVSMDLMWAFLTQIKQFNEWPQIKWVQWSVVWMTVKEIGCQHAWFLYLTLVLRVQILLQNSLKSITEIRYFGTFLILLDFNSFRRWFYAKLQHHLKSLSKTVFSAFWVW